MLSYMVTLFMFLISLTTQARPRWEAFRSNFSILTAFLPQLDLEEFVS